MPLYDSAGLLALFKRRARRPAADAALPDPDIYRYLSIGQESALRLTTNDNGVTYTFGQDPEDNTKPVNVFGHVELKIGKTGAWLRPGNEWNPASDFVQEGDTIRFPGGIAKVFPEGLYGRFVARPKPIDASTQPSLKPIEARVLIVDYALIEWAEELGSVDPSKFHAAFRRHWFGDPTVGDHGILGMLRTQYLDDGTLAYDDGLPGKWWPVDTGEGFPGAP
jgi:hypothetical protein